MKIKISKKDFEKVMRVEPELLTEEQDSEEKNRLKSQLDEIDKEYESSPGWTYGGITIPKGEEKVFEMPSDTFIKDKAEGEISPLYDAKRQNTTHKSEVEREELEKQSDEVIKRAEESLSTLKSNYVKAKDNVSDQALKRGLERSSIVLEQLKDLDKGESNAMAGILSERDAGLNNVDSRIYNLEKTLENAIKVLNEEEAKEVAKRVEEIVKDYEKQKNEVNDYNNQLRQQTNALKTQLLSMGIDPSEENSDEYKRMYASKIKAFYSYYYSLGGNALNELSKDKDYVVEHLGDEGYQVLREYFK